MKRNGLDRPNIIIMYADDLGFGDVGCYGADGIETPNVDRLCSQGVKFDRCFTTAATCTPARYSILTGNYPWRSPNAHILPGDAPLIISQNILTLPGFLRQAGYTTGVVGKWHLGLGAPGRLDWNEEIQGCPLDVGFDKSFIMAATNDRVPCVFIDGRKVKGLEADDPIEVRYAQENPFPGIPTGRDNPELLKMRHSMGHDGTIVNGVGRIGYMRGGRRAVWKDEDMCDVFLNQAVSFVEENRDHPFFLYYAFHEPHVPRIPNPRFAGRTKRGPRGDSIVEMDWCVGEMLDTLDRLGLSDNTVVIFSSDNGPVLDDGYADCAVELTGSHRPAGPLRGGKYSLYDGGTCVPFIVRWPGQIRPGQSNKMISQVDLYASFAALLGLPLSEDAAVDSLNMLDVLLNVPEAQERPELAAEGIGRRVNYHRAGYVYIPAYPGLPDRSVENIETGYSDEAQLYDLSQDIGQRQNLAHRPEFQEMISSMARRLDEIMAGKRTR